MIDAALVRRVWCLRAPQDGCVFQHFRVVLLLWSLDRSCLGRKGGQSKGTTNNKSTRKQKKNKKNKEVSAELVGC